MGGAPSSLADVQAKAMERSQLHIQSSSPPTGLENESNNDFNVRQTMQSDSNLLNQKTPFRKKLFGTPAPKNRRISLLNSGNRIPSKNRRISHLNSGNRIPPKNNTITKKYFRIQHAAKFQTPRPSAKSPRTSHPSTIRSKTPSVSNIPGRSSVARKYGSVRPVFWGKKQQSYLISWLNHELHPTCIATRYLPVSNIANSVVFTKQVTAMQDLYQKQFIKKPLNRIKTEIAHARFFISRDIRLLKHISPRNELISLILTNYHPNWLLLALSVVCGANIAHDLDEAFALAKKNGGDFEPDKIFMSVLEEAIVSKFLLDDISRTDRASLSASKNNLSPQSKQHEQYNALILYRFMSLIYLLDNAKSFPTPIIDHDPSLFRSTSAMTSSEDVLKSFEKRFLKEQGDTLRFLKQRNYVLKYKTRFLEREEYLSTRDISSDLCDGVRLCKLASIFTDNPDILDKVEQPRASLGSSQVTNVRIKNISMALAVIQEHAKINGQNQVHWKASPRDIANGDVESTVRLLWQIVRIWMDTKVLNEARIRSELEIVKKQYRDILRDRESPSGRRALPELSPMKESPSRLPIHEHCQSKSSQLLIHWIAVVCGMYGVRVTDYTESFRDGTALCLILHHYNPQLIDTSDFTRVRAKELRFDSSAELEAAQVEQNFELFNSRCQVLGAVPEIKISWEEATASCFVSNEKADTFGRAMELLSSYLFSILVMQREASSSPFMYDEPTPFKYEGNMEKSNKENAPENDKGLSFENGHATDLSDVPINNFPSTSTPGRTVHDNTSVARSSTNNVKPDKQQANYSMELKDNESNVSSGTVTQVSTEIDLQNGENVIVEHNDDSSFTEGSKGLQHETKIVQSSDKVDFHRNRLHESLPESNHSHGFRDGFKAADLVSKTMEPLTIRNVFGETTDINSALPKEIDGADAILTESNNHESNSMSQVLQQPNVVRLRDIDHLIDSICRSNSDDSMDGNDLCSVTQHNPPVVPEEVMIEDEDSEKSFREKTLCESQAKYAKANQYSNHLANNTVGVVSTSRNYIHDLVKYQNDMLRHEKEDEEAIQRSKIEEKNASYRKNWKTISSEAARVGRLVTPVLQAWESARKAYASQLQKAFVEAHNEFEASMAHAEARDAKRARERKQMKQREANYNDFLEKSQNDLIQTNRALQEATDASDSLNRLIDDNYSENEHSDRGSNLNDQEQSMSPLNDAVQLNAEPEDYQYRLYLEALQKGEDLLQEITKLREQDAILFAHILDEEKRRGAQIEDRWLQAENDKEKYLHICCSFAEHQFSMFMKRTNEARSSEKLLRLKNQEVFERDLRELEERLNALNESDIKDGKKLNELQNMFEPESDDESMEEISYQEEQTIQLCYKAAEESAKLDSTWEAADRKCDDLLKEISDSIYQIEELDNTSSDDDEAISEESLAVSNINPYTPEAKLNDNIENDSLVPTSGEVAEGSSGDNTEISLPSAKIQNVETSVQFDSEHKREIGVTNTVETQLRENDLFATTQDILDDRGTDEGKETISSIIAKSEENKLGELTLQPEENTSMPSLVVVNAEEFGALRGSSLQTDLLQGPLIPEENVDPLAASGSKTTKPPTQGVSIELRGSDDVKEFYENAQSNHPTNSITDDTHDAVASDDQACPMKSPDELPDEKDIEECDSKNETFVTNDAQISNFFSSDGLPIVNRTSQHSQSTGSLLGSPGENQFFDSYDKYVIESSSKQPTSFNDLEVEYHSYQETDHRPSVSSDPSNDATPNAEREISEEATGELATTSDIRNARPSRFEQIGMVWDQVVKENDIPNFTNDNYERSKRDSMVSATDFENSTDTSSDNENTESLYTSETSSPLIDEICPDDVTEHDEFTEQAQTEENAYGQISETKSTENEGHEETPPSLGNLLEQDEIHDDEKSVSHEFGADENYKRPDGITKISRPWCTIPDNLQAQQPGSLQTPERTEVLAAEHGSMTKLEERPAKDTEDAPKCVYEEDVSNVQNRLDKLNSIAKEASRPSLFDELAGIGLESSNANAVLRNPSSAQKLKSVMRRISVSPKGQLAKTRHQHIELVRTIFIVIRQCARAPEHINLVELAVTIVRDICEVQRYVPHVIEVDDCVEVLTTCVQFYRDHEKILEAAVNTLWQISVNADGEKLLISNTSAVKRLKIVNDIVRMCIVRARRNTQRMKFAEVTNTVLQRRKNIPDSKQSLSAEIFAERARCSLPEPPLANAARILTELVESLPSTL